MRGAVRAGHALHVALAPRRRQPEKAGLGSYNADPPFRDHGAILRFCPQERRARPLCPPRAPGRWTLSGHVPGLVLYFKSTGTCFLP